MFLQLLPKISKNQWEKNNLMEVHEWLAHGVHFLLIFSWLEFLFSWFLGTTPESYLKPWEEIQHSQDLKIESANKFQHGLWSLFSNQNPPIHALCSKIFFKNMTFLAWSHIMPCIKWQSGIILYSPLRKGSAVFNWNESKVIFKETAVQSSFRGKSVFLQFSKRHAVQSFLKEVL